VGSVSTATVSEPTALECYEARAAELERQKAEALQTIADAIAEEQAARTAETERAPSGGLTFKVGNPVDAAIKKRTKAEAKLANIEKDLAALAPLLNAERQKFIEAERVVEERRHADALRAEEPLWRKLGEQFAELWSTMDELLDHVETNALLIPEDETAPTLRVTGQDQFGNPT